MTQDIDLANRNGEAPTFTARTAESLTQLLHRNDRWKILLAAAVFIVLRSPILLLRGRMIAEEGTVYFQDAWNSPFWHALFAPHQGYYSLLDNLVAAFAANLVPLPWASVVFTFAAFLMLLVLVSVVLDCELFQTPLARLLAVTLALTAPSVEVWMTLEDAQFLLGASVAIIFLSAAQRHLGRRIAILLFAGFTGPVACSFLPFFWLKAIRERSRGAILQALAFTVPTAVQAVAVLGALSSGQRSLSGLQKLHWLGPIFFLKIVAVTFGTRLSFFLFLSLLLHHASTALFLLCWLLALAGLSAILRLARMGGPIAWWMLTLAGWNLCFAYAGIGEDVSVLLGGANRYFYIADLLLWLMLLQIYLEDRRTSKRPFLRALVLYLVFSGMLDTVGYWKRLQRIENPWRPQATAWQHDPSRTIAVNPSDWPHRVVLLPHR